MIVGLTYDLRTQYVFKSSDPPDANAEFDHPDTIQVIQDAIEALGHRVVRIGNAEGLLLSFHPEKSREAGLLQAWNALPVDLVFNIAEGYAGRNREAQVPILLEMRGIPYTGSDGLTQALTLDKRMTKKVLLAEGIPTPRFFEMAHPSDPLPQDLIFPLIVKPRFEGSSKGLSEQSVVRSMRDLRAQAEWLMGTYHQPALVEEFIRGNEFTVAIVGNEAPEVFPAVRIQIDGRDELGDLFYTHARIAEGAKYVIPARIDAGLERRLQELALATYRAVDCVDFGRVDFRVDEGGNPFVLEINPLPSLSTEDVFGILAGHLGLPYGAMIAKILNAAIRRYGLSQESLHSVVSR